MEEEINRFEYVKQQMELVRDERARLYLERKRLEFEELFAQATAEDWRLDRRRKKDYGR